MKPRKVWINKNNQATSRVRQDPYLCKIMLSVWWGMEGILHWKLLDRNQTINAEVFSQMRRIATVVQQKQPNRPYKLILQYFACNHQKKKCITNRKVSFIWLINACK